MHLAVNGINDKQRLVFLADLLAERKSAGILPCGAGLIVYHRTIELRRLPIYEPSIVIVLSGQKTVLVCGKPTHFTAGSVIALRPTVLDMMNVVDKASGCFVSLFIPVEPGLLDRLRRVTNVSIVQNSAHGVWKRFTLDTVLTGIVRHFLGLQQPLLSEEITEHRLSEILLYLLQQDLGLYDFFSVQRSSAQKVRALLETELSAPWQLKDVCEQLAVSESTLRRQLKEEGYGFRQILQELRLSAAFNQLAFSQRAISEIAFDCGYPSIPRFTENFKKQFGITPGKLRQALMNDTGKIMSVSG
jgi:AraC-like DNA-binding protein